MVAFWYGALCDLSLCDIQHLTGAGHEFCLMGGGNNDPPGHALLYGACNAPGTEWVQIGRRLIKHQHIGLAQQGAGQRQTPCLPLGQTAATLATRVANPCGMASINSRASAISAAARRASGEASACPIRRLSATEP